MRGAAVNSRTCLCAAQIALIAMFAARELSGDPMDVPVAGPQPNNNSLPVC
jgi:hypothetical protein